MDRNNLFIFLKKKNKTKIHFSPFISASGQNSRCQAQITISAPRTLKKAIGTRNIWRRSTSKRIHLACYPPEKEMPSPPGGTCGGQQSYRLFSTGEHVFVFPVGNFPQFYGRPPPRRPEKKFPHVNRPTTKQMSGSSVRISAIYETPQF